MSKPTANDASSSLARWATFGLWLLGIGLTIAAALLMLGTWKRLPHGLDVDPSTWNARWVETMRAAPQEARDAHTLLVAGYAVTRQQFSPDPLQFDPDTIAALRRVSTTFLNRLVLAMPTLDALRDANAPAADWWPTVEPQLGRLDRAPLAHNLSALAETYVATHRAMGLSLAEARDLANRDVEGSLNPLLNALATDLRDLETHAAAAGQTEAVTTCQRLRRMLLASFVLEPGPSGLKLLAADLLAEELQASDPPLAAKLRDLRTSYRETMRSRPTPMMHWSSEPVYALPEYDAAAFRLGAGMWFLGVTIGLGLWAGSLGWLPLVSAGAGCGQRELATATTTLTVVGLLGLVLSDVLWDGVIVQAWRAPFEWTDPGTWHHYALLAGLVGLLAPPTVARLQRTARSYLDRLAAYAVVAWCAFALVTLCIAVSTDSAVTRWLEARAAVAEDPLYYIASEAAQTAFDSLLNWQP